ncbi:MAG: putative ABC transporter permease [Lachnospiraceae bacterium]|nr:putative ABC transporter permease [Lachnospiraceae bacterium]
MVYSFYEIGWFFFIYSFIGWVAEVCTAAYNKKKFINRGFVSGPFCPIYGTGAAAFAVFLPELHGSVFFLFLGGAILASFIEFLTGALLEKIFHRKWWDYSGKRFHFEGFICLQYSTVWGICAVLLIYFVNPFFATFIKLVPGLIGLVLLWGMGAVLALDAVGTALAIWGMQKRMEQISQLTEGMVQVSRLLENAITKRITRRMEMAFPVLEAGELKKQAKPKVKLAVFAAGCSFYKLASLFFIGAFLGDITETVFCLITTGRLMSRSSVVYGPFSIVWGLGCALLTAVLYRIRDKSDSYIFVAGTLLGGAYEYICSVFTELVFGTVFWDYSGFRFNLGGRINLLYCFFWGIAAVVWMKFLYPLLSKWIEKLPEKAGSYSCNLMIIFMIFNCLISALALGRYEERQRGDFTRQQESPDGIDMFLDERFPDERMERIYPNAKIVYE